MKNCLLFLVQSCGSKEYCSLRKHSNSVLQRVEEYLLVDDITFSTRAFPADVKIAKKTCITAAVRCLIFMFKILAQLKSSTRIVKRTV